MAVLVINEVLTYLFNRFEIDDAADIKGTINRYYGPEAIAAARDLLLEKYDAILQPPNERVHRSQQSLKEKHIEDIYNGVKVVQKKHSGDQVLPVTFVAVNLSNLPTSARETDALLMTRIKMLETQMAESCSIREFQQLESRVNRMSVQPPKHIAAPSVTQGASDGMLYSVKAANSNVANAGGIIAGNNGFGKQTNDDDPDRPWTVKTNKRPKTVYGTKEGCSVKSGPRRHAIFIFRLHSDVTEDEIKSYVETESKSSASVIEIQCKSKPESWTKCYRLLIQCPDVDVVLDKDFWGDGIGVRPYIGRYNAPTGGMLRNNNNS